MITHQNTARKGLPSTPFSHALSHRLSRLVIQNTACTWCFLPRSSSMLVLLHVTAFIGRHSYGPQGRYASLKESKRCRRVKASLGLTSSGVWNKTQVVGVPGDTPNDMPLLLGCSLLRQPLDGPLNLHHGHPDQATAPSVNLHPPPFFMSNTRSSTKCCPYRKLVCFPNNEQ